MHKQAPEIFQRPLTSLDLADLPPTDDPGFEQAVIAHYAFQYAAKGWNAAVVVSDGMVRVVAMEIAQLGETGLEINNPLKHYSLTNLDGDFSGLQLLCYMHVGMALFAPGVDCGSGLQREYEIAKGMTGK